MKKAHQILIVVGIFYVIYILLFLAKFDFNPSATIELSKNNIGEYNGTLPSNLVVQINRDGYDGQHYYMIATDIFLNRISGASCWYQRILYPALASVFAFGNISLIPWTLLLVNFTAILLGTYIFIRILEGHKSNLNLAYLFALNPGFLSCVIRDLCEPLMVLFILLAIFFLEKKRHGLSSALLALAILTKEMALLIVCALLLYFLIKRRFREMVIYSFPLIIFLVWQLIVFIKFGDSSFPPVAKSISGRGLPLLGVIEYFSLIRYPQNLMDIHVYYLTLPLLGFLVVQLYVILRGKQKTISVYLIILLFQILFIFCMDARAHFINQFNALVRYAIPLFLFSILYSAERKEKYNILLIVCMTLMSVCYFIEKIILFKGPLFRVDYFVT